MIFSPNPEGHIFETKNFILGFGNNQSSWQKWSQQFSNYRFSRVHQVHGDIAVEVKTPKTENLIQADAHFTDVPGLALCISTADCLPILIFHQDPNWICAIHAGWRGVENRITVKSLKKIKSLYSFDPKKISVFIGPHVQKESFEIEESIGTSILGKSVKKDSIFTLKENRKCHVALSQVIQNQLAEFQIASSQIQELKIDTVTSTSHHSYRRDREKSGRQQSWIALKN